MSGKTHVLIADDSAIIRKIIEKSIGKDKFEVIGIADNGVNALEQFKEKLPEVVTLDLTMPEMDGLSVLDEMIKIKPDVNVIVISALTDKATGIEAIRKGAKFFIPKPFTPEDVQKALEKFAIN
jgi:two-component system chemotaxis response regulator CheY